MQKEGINIQADKRRLHVSWDNRKARKDSFLFWFFIIFWIIWASATCLSTAMIFYSDSPIFFAIWSIGGWIVTIAIPSNYFRRTLDEWLELTTEAISWGTSGMVVKTEKVLSLSDVDEFVLGWYFNGIDHESIVTLNIYEVPKKIVGSIRHRRRYILGNWLSEGNKKYIFERIGTFISERKIDLKTAIYKEMQ